MPVRMNLQRLMLLLLVSNFVARSAGTLSAQSVLNREPNTTLKLPSDVTPHGYSLVPALRSLQFTNPTAMAVPPGETNRLFVLERGGRIIVITNLANPTRTVFLNISSSIDQDYLVTGEEGLLGLAFHPGYATNRFLFVTYGLLTNTVQGSGRHQRVARFQTSAANPNFVPASSEVPLITQFDRANIHSYNDLLFSPEGYLYVSVGDEGGFLDEHNNSQRIDKNLFSGILRLDVDQLPSSLAPNPHPAVNGNYAIPPDNPFVGATEFNGAPVNPAQVRTEFYAVGLRNPYRMFYDRVDDRLYCSDVGEASREEINLIVKGGNYGWAFYEGNAPSMKKNMPPPPAGFVSIPPVWEYFHDNGLYDGHAAIGGIVYRGTRIGQLTGHYIFGDYVDGHVWSMTYDGTTPVVEWLVSDSGISGFGTDPRNGDILVVDHDEGFIRRLEYSTNSTAEPLPDTLAGTGAFADLATLTPAAGVVPYDVNVPFWSDHALKTRWFSLPDLNDTFDFSPGANWFFPAGTVWIKHFDLELSPGEPSSAHRLETRLLVRTPTGVYGATYRWGDSMTDATLVPEEGMDESFVIQDAGVVRTQVWHYPGRSECRTCHTSAGGYALGFNTAQLNKDFHYAGGVDNQIHALSRAGYLSAEVTELNSLRALAPATDDTSSLEYRVRSYLAVNCSQCHQPGGLAVGTWDARASTPMADAGIIDGLLLNNLGDSNNRVIKPGSVKNSVLLRRISTLGSERMPPLASRVLDEQAIALVSQWITTGLSNYQSFLSWQGQHFGDPYVPEAATLADPDQDGAPNFLEYLTDTDPWEPADFWSVTIAPTSTGPQLSIKQKANLGFAVEFSPNLVDWFFLDVPGNRPSFPAADRLSTILDPSVDGPARFYRVRALAP